MKLSNFDDLPGATDLDKCAALLALSDKTELHGQRKYNGVSCIVKRLGPYDLRFITCRGKEWPRGFFGETREQAWHRVFDQLPAGIALYAEIVTVRDIPLATLAGWVNCNSPRMNDEAVAEVRFVVYDAIVAHTAEPFELRRKHLDVIFDISFTLPHVGGISPAINFCPTILLKTKEHVELYYREAVAFQYEGVVYRIDPCFHYDGREKSPSAFKRKRYYEVEGKIVTAIEGIGKRAGMLGSFGVELPDNKLVFAGGGRDIDDALLTKWWNERGAMMGTPLTIRYEELSKDGTPLRIQIVAPRSYE
jgi:ATP-dependent DNA ligase